jgi:hypothetical protein
MFEVVFAEFFAFENRIFSSTKNIKNPIKASFFIFFYHPFDLYYKILVAHWLKLACYKILVAHWLKLACSSVPALFLKASDNSFRP